MIVVRLLVVLFAFALVASLLAGVFTGNRKYYVWVGRILRGGLFTALAVAALFVIERFVLR